MKRMVAPFSGVAHRVHVGEITEHRLVAPRADPLGCRIGACKRANAVAVRSQSLDQPRADEPRSARDGRN
jgi:hypothetical protein